MTPLLQALELIVRICEALDTAPELMCESGRVFSPAFPGVRRPRKPWRVGIDPTDFVALLQVENIDSAWMPLAGGSQAEGLEMLVDSINAHIGIELELADAGEARLAAPTATELAGVDLPDGPISWRDLSARLAAA